jgi:hypothetical protein
MLTVANTLKNEIKSLLCYFRGSVVLHILEHSRTDQIKCVVSQLQPSQAMLARQLRLALALIRLT